MDGLRTPGMSSLDNTVSKIMARAAALNPPKSGDYDMEGITYCGTCKRPKTAIIDWLPLPDGTIPKKLVHVACDCEVQEANKTTLKYEKDRFDAFMTELRGFYKIQDSSVISKFSDDDMSRPPITRACKEYVRQWDEMKSDGIGILFYGPVGTGKSFYASCIINSLLDGQITAVFTSTARIMNIVQSAKDKQAVIDHLQQYSLIALDDLGAERATSYAAEIIYSVIDARYRSGLPMIVTTNMDIEDMKAESDTYRRRIYDRVLQMCPIPLKIDGESRREKAAQERRDKARKLLAGAANG